MLSIYRGNVFAINKTQQDIAEEFLSNIEGKKIKKIYDGFLANIENKIKKILPESISIAHAITYPDQKTFVDITFLEKPRIKWPTPKAAGPVYHLRRLQNKIGELIRKGHVVNKNSNTGEFNLPELTFFENKLKTSLVGQNGKIIKILNTSKNPKEIAEHILLLQYIEPSDALLNVLYNCLSSEFEIVQNNAAYVLGNFMDQVTDWQFEQIFSLLDSPFSAPVNKGLYLLSKLLQTNISEQKKKIIYDRAKTFTSNRQPNISSIAQMITKR